MLNKEIKDKLAKLHNTATDICSMLWNISEDESLTEKERELIESYALDADQLGCDLKQLSL